MRDAAGRHGTASGVDRQPPAVPNGRSGGGVPNVPVPPVATGCASMDRPILFAGRLVRAILDGRKTQTRRIVNPDPAWLPEVTHARLTGPFMWPIGGLGQQCGAPLTRLPYGVPGDRLWVRETWGYRGSSWDSRTPTIRHHHVHFRADDTRTSIVRPDNDRSGIPVFRCRCKPVGPGRTADDVWDFHQLELDRYWKSWRPSIFMPRWASRLTLEVTEVRVERLQDITEEDARAEGMPGEPGDWHVAKQAFADGWDSINGNRAPWASNPWVWAITFRRVD